jgi:hypothetical protein
MAIEVKLTWTEITEGALVGVMRQVQNLIRGRTDKHGAEDEDPFAIHIRGALGEMALAKHRNLYWGGAGIFRGDDVGPFQVRAADAAHKRLIVHPDDADEKAFVHITGRPPTLTLRGWLYGRDAKRQEWWEDPTRKGRPAYFVPNDRLLDIDTLAER